MMGLITKRSVACLVAAAFLAVFSMPAWAADAQAGKQIFAQCLMCHTIGPNASIRIGPPLNGVVGRKWASYPPFSYSAGLVAGRNKGNVWTAAMLNKWLTNPGALVPGTRMTFAGLSDPAQRQDVIAYLSRFGADGSQH